MQEGLQSEVEGSSRQSIAQKAPCSPLGPRVLEFGISVLRVWGLEFRGYGFRVWVLRSRVVEKEWK